MKNKDGKLSDTSKETVDVLNHAFHSVFVKSDGEVGKNIENKNYQGVLDKISVMEIVEVIKNFNENKAAGPDNILY